MSSLVFAPVTTADAAQLLAWRTSERVTRYMRTDFDGTVEGQANWIESRVGAAGFRHWVVRRGDTPFAYLSMQIDSSGKTADWAYYIGNEDMLMLGAYVPLAFHNKWVFDFGYEATFADVAEENEAVRKLHASHGYVDLSREPNGIDKPYLRCDIIRMRLGAEQWKQDFKPFHRFVADWTD